MVASTFLSMNTWGGREKDHEGRRYRKEYIGGWLNRDDHRNSFHVVMDISDEGGR